MLKTSTNSVQKVYDVLKLMYPETLRSVAAQTGLTIKTVGLARDWLVEKGYLRVVGFGSRGALLYAPTTDNKVVIHGEVSSIEDKGFLQQVNISAFKLDDDGEEVPIRWTLELDARILKAIADYVKNDSEIPFF